LLLPGCKFGSHDTPTSPGSGSTSSGGQAVIIGANAVNIAGGQPAPLLVNGITYIYINTGGNAGIAVNAAADGVTFSSVPANYPAGLSRSIVTLPDGHFRMYYFAASTSVDLSSAVSSDGLNWTVESGARYSDPTIGFTRAAVLPNGGLLLYFQMTVGTIGSALSSDGLSFSFEGPVVLPQPDATFSWNDPGVIYFGGQFHMVLTKNLTSGGLATLWHARSTDGRTWTVDGKAFVSDGTNNLSQAQWLVNGNTVRVYFRALAPGSSSSVIASGTVQF